MRIPIAACVAVVIALFLLPAPGRSAESSGAARQGSAVLVLADGYPGTIPEWHPARGLRAWLFADEILVDP